jgi:hypothetical protein
MSRVLVAVLFGALLLSGCSVDVDAGQSQTESSSEPDSVQAQEQPAETPKASKPPAASKPPTAAAQPRASGARARLAKLRVVDRHAAHEPYSRSAFGSAWSDTDGNGCNQRDDVLLRDAVPGSVRTAQQGRCDHDVLAGRWRDPYTGRMLVFDDLKNLSQAQAIQIDHIVPLSEAWSSGADKWDSDRRREFANDLPGLLAVDGPTNASKRDYDPAAWRPRKGYQCEYAKRWIRVKSKWDLAIDRSEKRALLEMLDYCG